MSPKPDNIASMAPIACRDFDARPDEHPRPRPDASQVVERLQAARQLRSPDGQCTANKATELQYKLPGIEPGNSLHTEDVLSATKL